MGTGRSAWTPSPRPSARRRRTSPNSCTSCRRRACSTRPRARGGGVRLSADSRTLTLFDLCVALDDDILHPKCALGIAECSDERACPAHALQVAIRAEQLAFLKRTTILSVGEFNARRAGGAATPNDATEPSAHGA